MRFRFEGKKEAAGVCRGCGESMEIESEPACNQQFSWINQKPMMRTLPAHAASVWRNPASAAPAASFLPAIRTLPGLLLRESAGDLDRVQTLQYADDARAIARDSQHSEDLARNFTLCRQRPCVREPAPCCGGKWQSVRPGIRSLYGCADGR